MQKHSMKQYFTPEDRELRYLPGGPQLISGTDPTNPVMGWVGVRNHGGVRRLSGTLNLLNMASKVNVSYKMPGTIGFFVQTDKPGVYVSGITDTLCLVCSEENRGIRKTKYVIPGRRNFLTGIATSCGLLFSVVGENLVGEIYLLGPDGHLQLVKTGVYCSGLAELFKDGERLHIVYSDRTRKQLVELSIHTDVGSFREVRCIRSFADEDTYPSGIRLAPTNDDLDRSIMVAFYSPEEAGYGLLRDIRLRDGETRADWDLVGSTWVTDLAVIPGEPLGGPKNSVKVMATTANADMGPDFRRTGFGRGSFYIGETDFDADHLPAPVLLPLSMFE